MQIQQAFDMLRRTIADPLAYPGVAAIALVVLVVLVLIVVLLIVAFALPGRGGSDDETSR